MSSASDISNLFEMLGVSPSHYQEVERTEQVQGSRGRWSMPTMPAPADTMGDGAASDVQAAAPAVVPVAAPADVPTDATEPALAEPPQPVASTVPAADSIPVPQSPAAPEPPALQSDPEPAAARQQPDSLSAVFARLRGSNGPQEDIAQRQTS